jgi:hypothetical protein
MRCIDCQHHISCADNEALVYCQEHDTAEPARDYWDRECCSFKRKLKVSKAKKDVEAKDAKYGKLIILVRQQLENQTGRDKKWLVSVG